MSRPRGRQENARLKKRQLRSGRVLTHSLITCDSGRSPGDSGNPPAVGLVASVIANAMLSPEARRSTVPVA